MLVRGKYIILTIAFLTIGAAAFAWWFNVRQSRRCVEFWGRPAAELLRGAAQADFLRLADGVPPSSDKAELIKLGERELQVVERKTLQGAPGEFHDFIEDRSFAWDRPGQPVASRDASQLLGLQFTGENSTVTILVDLPSGALFNLNRNAAVFLTEELAQQLRDLARQQFAPAPVSKQ